MKVPKDTLISLTYAHPTIGVDGYEKVADEHITNTRWDEHRLLVFKYAGLLWRVAYHQGLTENQDYGPFEWADDEIECEEAKAVEETVVRYVPRWDVDGTETGA